LFFPEDKTNGKQRIRIPFIQDVKYGQVCFDCKGEGTKKERTGKKSKIKCWYCDGKGIIPRMNPVFNPVLNLSVIMKAKENVVSSKGEIE